MALATIKKAIAQLRQEIERRANPSRKPASHPSILFVDEAGKRYATNAQGDFVPFEHPVTRPVLVIDKSSLDPAIALGLKTTPIGLPTADSAVKPMVHPPGFP